MLTWPGPVSISASSVLRKHTCQPSESHSCMKSHRSQLRSRSHSARHAAAVGVCPAPKLLMSCPFETEVLTMAGLQYLGPSYAMGSSLTSSAIEARAISSASSPSPPTRSMSGEVRAGTGRASSPRSFLSCITRSTDSSTRSMGTRPSETSLTRDSENDSSSGTIDMSIDVLFIARCTASCRLRATRWNSCRLMISAQSVTSMPRKPSSSRRTLRRYLCDAAMGTPFTSLYDSIAVRTFARFTAASKGSK
mmetsp:Transcript_12769/g.33332  ORF Transcript_12769/g.33332 Transcript_12769/m.33332 type:complete len:250 (+) Transcript_12769:1927-2676(+)